MASVHRPFLFHSPPLSAASDNELLSEMQARKLWPPWAEYRDAFVTDEHGYTLTLYTSDGILQRGDDLYLLPRIQIDVLRCFLESYPTPLKMRNLAQLLFPTDTYRSASYVLRMRMYYLNIAVPNLLVVSKRNWYGPLWKLGCEPPVDPPYDPAVRNTIRHHYSYKEVPVQRGIAKKLTIRDLVYESKSNNYGKGVIHAKHD